jgi:hypothetical protein
MSIPRFGKARSIKEAFGEIDAQTKNAAKQSKQRQRYEKNKLSKPLTQCGFPPALAKIYSTSMSSVPVTEESFNTGNVTLNSQVSPYLSVYTNSSNWEQTWSKDAKAALAVLQD